MNIKEKLAKLDKTRHSMSLPKKELREHNFSSVLPGKEYQTESGICWLNQTKYELIKKHGLFQISEIFQNNPEDLQFIAKNSEYNSIPLDNLLFIDTETTGLSGGIGTVAFLIGIGYFKENHFLIDQYFMRGFNEESAVLDTFIKNIKNITSSKGAVVSFNGKSYDLPLLINRSIFHRFIRTTPYYQHIDLLHSSRRFWKKSLPDCTLNTVESKILSVERTGDVPGFMIPEIYFRYLRTKDPRPLTPVFYHNQMDILSLVGILHIMLQFYFRNENVSKVPLDWLAVGSAYDEMERFEKGMEFYKNLLTQNLSLQEQKETFLRLARLNKKKQNYQQAIQFWREALRLPEFSVEPYVELAKIYEHRIMNLSLAREYTCKALENIRLLEQLGRKNIRAEEKQDLMWRFQRLERKIDKASEYNFSSDN